MIRDIIVLSDVKAKGVFIAYAQVVGVTVKESSSEIRKLYESVKRKILSTYTLESLKENPIVKAYRRFYWSIGIDPTKQRPSSEALIRRILRGLDIPFINNVVDIGNIVSVETLIPIGIYDLDKIKGEVLYLRMSRSGEVFHPIGGSVEVLDSGQIVLADNEKILHVYPHRDSEFTKVTKSTRNILIISCGVSGVNRSLVREALDKVVQNIVRYAGGELIGVRVV
ncbi:MAG TPA: hypothetical protein EYH40_04085 [Desulfurococcales archaeon]|nr:hypothetical protein [Desulfurococcales archaeon]